MDASGLWLILALALLIAEAVSLGVFLLFFGCGALVTGLVLRLVPLTFPLQITLFLLVSIILLLLLRNTMRNWLQRSRSKKEELDNIEDVMGREGTVIKAIKPPESGVVDLHGTTWKARAQQAIGVGTQVVVVGRQNLILDVEVM